MIVESVPTRSAGSRRSWARPPPHRRILARYASERRAVLFDYFEHAAPAFRAATEEIRKSVAPRRRRAARPEGGG
ncbi:hypothetical protein ACIF83_17095 [Streptomyces sp. NPDC085866]|uniref:hypothetical protein n=1 Tax=Streptomyces sp. NPDC085866 TaxID=3365736 RepID=UPI0037CF5D61